MFILYTVAPWIYRLASSAFYNISLLTSDFYGLLFGLFLFVRRSIIFTLSLKQKLYSTSNRSGYISPRLSSSFLVSLSTFGTQRVCLSLLAPLPPLTHACTAEEQGKLDPQAPSYVTRRGQRHEADVTDSEDPGRNEGSDDVKDAEAMA